MHGVTVTTISVSAEHRPGDESCCCSRGGRLPLTALSDEVLAEIASHLELRVSRPHTSGLADGPLGRL